MNLALDANGALALLVMVAGTFVIQERVASRPFIAAGVASIPLPLAGWARNVELSRLSDQTAAAASSYLRRYFDLEPDIALSADGQLLIYGVSEGIFLWDIIAGHSIRILTDSQGNLNIVLSANG